MVIRIKELCQIYKPDYVAMEQVLPQDVKHNQKVYKILIYLQAAIVMQLHEMGLQIDLIHVSHWRKVCGIKTGTKKREELKQASKQLVKAIYGIEVNDDISDAICLGIAYISENRKKSAF